MRQPRHFRTMQNSQRQAHHLQVLTSRSRGDIARLRPHIVYDSLLQPRDEEVRALTHNLLLDSANPVEDDGSCTTLDVVDGGVEERHTCRGRDGQPVEIVEGIGRHGFM